MSVIDFSNFERQGNIENDIQLSNAEETREAILNYSITTLRTIKIFTPDMEQIIYNNNAMRQNLISFIRGNRHAKVQILVDEISTAIHEGHRLIHLAQQLTSAMTIKNTPDDYKNTNIAFILFDQSSFIFKPDRASHNAIYSNCKHRANKLLEFFTPAWEQGEQDVHTRRYSL